MTEQEILCRAKEYIDKLANGIDPLTDTPVSENDIVNHIRIARCLFYVSDVLGRVIANGFLSKTRRPPKQPFSITEDALAKLEYSDAPIPLSHFLQRLNTLINQDAMQKLSYHPVRSWLVRAASWKRRTGGTENQNSAPRNWGRRSGSQSKSGRTVIILPIIPSVIVAARKSFSLPTYKRPSTRPHKTILGLSA